MNQNATTCPKVGGDLNVQAQQIQSRADLIRFVRELAADLRRQPETWENRDLTTYLGAIAAWSEDMDGYYSSRGEPVPVQPTWRTLGEILLAARCYE